MAQVSTTEMSRKTESKTASSIHLMMLSSSIPEPKKVESCLLKNVKVVHLDYENDSMFEVMDKIATVSKGIRFDTIGILEHGKRSQMDLVKGLTLSRHNWVINKSGVKDFFSFNCQKAFET